MRRILLFALLALPATATDVWLPTGDFGVGKHITTCTNATPVVCTTTAAHGFNVDDYVFIHSVRGNLASNGVRQVKTVPTSTTFGLKDLTGADVAGSGTPVANTGFARPAAQYTLTAHPRVLLDGPSGTLTLSLSTKAQVGNIPFDAWATNIASDIVGYSNPENWWQLGSGYPNGSWNVLPSAALRWTTNNSLTDYLTTVQWFMTRPEILTMGTGCNEAVSQCGGKASITDYANRYLRALAQAYSMIRSELTAGERATLAAKLFNDKTTFSETTGSVAYNSGGCTNSESSLTGTLTTSSASTTVSGSGTLFTSEVAAGDWIRIGSTIRYVVSITDDDTLVVGHVWGSTQVAQAGFVDHWDTGDCGAVWVLKHHSYWPKSIMADTGPSAYPTTGATYGVNEPLINHAITRTLSPVALGLAFADDSEQARGLLAFGYAYYIDVSGEAQQQWATGPTPSTINYWMTRILAFMTDIEHMVRSSVTALADRTYTLHLRGAQMLMWDKLPFAQDYHRWGYYDGADINGDGGTNISNFLTAECLDPSEATWMPYFRDWVKNRYSPDGVNQIWTSGSTFLNFRMFLCSVPSGTTTAMGSLPLAKVFNTTDRITDFPSQALEVLISRTGWPSDYTYSNTIGVTSFWPTDMPKFSTTSYQGYPGSYQISRGAKFVAGDSSNFVHELDNESTIQFGGDVDPAAAITRDTIVPVQGSWGLMTTYQDASIARYAVSDDTFAYALGDIAGTYKTDRYVTRANRHFLDMKNGQQVVVVYDDLAVSTPEVIRHFVHYHQNGGSGEGTTTYSSGEVTSRSTVSSMLTKFLSVSANSIAPTWQTSYTGNGLCGTPAAPCTYRASVCASTDGATCAAVSSAEFLTVHALADDLVSTMPATTLLTPTGWVGVQVAATTPKVALFPRAGASPTSLNVTTTHSSTAQYVIACPADGNYEVAMGGTPVSGSPFTCSTANGAMGFTSTAGTLTIGEGVGDITLNVSSTSLLFTGVVGGSNPSSQNVTASLTGGSGNIDSSESWSCSWLVVTGDGVAPATLVHAVDTTGLTAGSYSCDVTVSSVEATVGSPKTVSVSLTMSAGSTTITGAAITGATILP